MLKRKLTKAALIAVSFLFMAASSGGKSVGDQYRNISVSSDTTLQDTINLNIHAFDETGLCICVPDLTANQLTLAPRIELNKQANDFVNSYLKKNGFSLEKIKVKSSSYFTIINTIFIKYELPVELKYLAVIESKLNNKIISPAGAAGLWQLMPATARQFGLKVNGKNDERKQSYKSTIAAAKCLVSLHRIFDDWLLTLAAYNSGPGHVLSAIKKSGSRNFWVLQKYLPLETRNHVKRFIAMHYYFEGHGSLTTLTKSETKAHITAVSTFIEKQKTSLADSITIETVQGYK